MDNAFTPGKFYMRRKLHEDYGGQERGGISTPAGQPLIFLFTGQPGEPFGYKDWWDDNGIFHYFGEGQVGDMEFRAGNKAIRDHAANGKELHVFKMKRHDPQVCYVGQMLCIGHDIQSAPDVNGKPRKALVFRLRPLGTPFIGPPSASGSG